jgi:hypothetical protein
MSWRFKLVALLLAFTTLVMPASALAFCWLHMPAAQKCVPHCPMMAGHHSSASMAQAQASSACCQISAAMPTPPTMPQAPTSTFLVIARLATASTIDVLVEALTPSPPSDLIPEGSPQGLQAVLCTFLI